jgi:hypothetical protein
MSREYRVDIISSDGAIVASFGEIFLTTKAQSTQRKEKKEKVNKSNTIAFIFRGRFHPYSIYVLKISEKDPQQHEQASSPLFIAEPQSNGKFPLCVLCAFVVHFIYFFIVNKFFPMVLVMGNGC